MAPCPNCLGTKQCWVCVGTGLIDHPDAPRPTDPCSRCLGTGKCRDCRIVTIGDMHEPPPLLERRRVRRMFRAEPRLAGN